MGWPRDKRLPGHCGVDCGGIGLGTLIWKLFRKMRREDGGDTDVEEDIDVNGDTEDGGSGSTRKLRRRFHSRDWNY